MADTLLLSDLHEQTHETLIQEVFRLNTRVDTLVTVLYDTQQALREATGDPVVSD